MVSIRKKTILPHVSLADVDKIVWKNQFDRKTILPFHFDKGNGARKEIAGFFFSPGRVEKEKIRQALKLSDMEKTALSKLAHRGGYNAYHERRHEIFMIDLTNNKSRYQMVILSPAAGMKLIERGIWQAVEGLVQNQIIAGMNGQWHPESGESENYTDALIRQLTMIVNHAAETPCTKFTDIAGRRVIVTSEAENTDYIKAWGGIANRRNEIQLGNGHDISQPLKEGFESAAAGSIVLFTDANPAHRPVIITGNPEPISHLN